MIWIRKKDITKAVDDRVTNRDLRAWLLALVEELPSYDGQITLEGGWEKAPLTREARELGFSEKTPPYACKVCKSLHAFQSGFCPSCGAWNAAPWIKKNSGVKNE